MVDDETLFAMANEGISLDAISRISKIKIHTLTDILLGGISKRSVGKMPMRDSEIAEQKKLVADYIKDLESQALGRGNVDEFDKKTEHFMVAGLTVLEARIMSALSARIKTRSKLISEVYFDLKEPEDDRSINPIISKIRRKLSHYGIVILSHHGVGYQIDPATIENYERLANGDSYERKKKRNTRA